MRVLERSILAALGLAAMLTGCSAGPILGQLPPSLGGLPADAPASPAAPYQYPAVHDMPPPRAATPLTEQQQFKLEDELKAARDRQERRTGTDKKAAPKSKKNANDTKARKKSGDTAGARTNP